MKRTCAFGAMIVVLAGCRGVWSLGEAPDRLDGETNAASASSDAASSTGPTAPASSGAGEGGAGGSSAVSTGGSDAIGTSTGAGGAGGGALPDGPCGGCSTDDDCGSDGGECGDDGRCTRSVWTLSPAAAGVADHFAVTEELVAVVVDDGAEDSEAVPRADNRLVILDRTTGTLDSWPFAITSIGAIAADPTGLVVYAPRAPAGDTQLRVIDRDGEIAPWPGAPVDRALRGLRWDGGAPDGGGFFALTEGDEGDRLVRLEAGAFELCDASEDALPPSRLWTGASATERVVIADVDQTEHPMASLSLGGGACEVADVTPGAIESSVDGRPVALVAGNGYVATVVVAPSSRRLLIRIEGNIVFDEGIEIGHALAATSEGVLAMRDGRLSSFSPFSPATFEPVPGFGLQDAVVDVVVAGEAIFAVTIDSIAQAQLVCVAAR